MQSRFTDETAVMRHALALAAQGLGFVEPNPPVGAVIVDDELKPLGEGFHQRFGGPHAEVEAIRDAGTKAHDGTLFVTLEPCCHQGKTPPCTEAVLNAGLRRVVVAMQDPFPKVSGNGIELLRQAGLDVQVGLLADEAAYLLEPYIKRVTTGTPFVHAKWAMTLDGKIASRMGHSRWISNEKSREIVHRLRGRMDAIIVGSNTARLDDPLLTARPPGPRTPVRIVLDSRAQLSIESQLVATMDEAPLLVVAVESAPEENIGRLRDAGAEVLQLSADEDHPDLCLLLQELGRREMTNVLIEGGGTLLGAFFDGGLIDELHVFIAPKLVGGRAASTPLTGEGLPEVPELPQLASPTIEVLDGDIYIRGRICGVR